MVLDVASAVGPDGWITWEALTARVDRKTVARWTATGTLVRLQPGVYATSAAAPQWAIRVEAAVLSRGGVAATGRRWRCGASSRRAARST
jgi:hypothetical protein